MKECNHVWDKEKGTRIKSKPWAGLHSVIVRRCIKCNLIQEFDNGKSGWFGWYTASNYARSYAEHELYRDILTTNG